MPKRHDCSKITDPDRKAIASVLCQALKEDNMSVPILAGRAGINQATITNIFRSNHAGMPTPTTLAAIATGLTRDHDDAVDEEKAEKLYQDMIAAGKYAQDPKYEKTLRASSVTEIIRQRARGIQLRNRIMDMLDGIPYSSRHESKSPASDGLSFDLCATFEKHPEIGKWKFLYQDRNMPDGKVLSNFFYLLLQDKTEIHKEEKTIKYSIVTQKPSICETMREQFPHLSFRKLRMSGLCDEIEKHVPLPDDMDIAISVLLVGDDGQLQDMPLEPAETTGVRIDVKYTREWNLPVENERINQHAI